MEGGFVVFRLVGFWGFKGLYKWWYIDLSFVSLMILFLLKVSFVLIGRVIFFLRNKFVDCIWVLILFIFCGIDIKEGEVYDNDVAGLLFGLYCGSVFVVFKSLFMLLVESMEVVLVWGVGEGWINGISFWVIVLDWIVFGGFDIVFGWDIVRYERGLFLNKGDLVSDEVGDGADWVVIGGFFDFVWV